MRTFPPIVRHCGEFHAPFINPFANRIDNNLNLRSKGVFKWVVNWIPFFKHYAVWYAAFLSQLESG